MRAGPATDHKRRRTGTNETRTETVGVVAVGIDPGEATLQQRHRNHQLSPEREAMMRAAGPHNLRSGRPPLGHA